MKKPTKARKYQKQGIRKIEGVFNCRCLVADEMGLGKTFTSLKVLQRNKRMMLPALVICPAPLKWNWADEASKHIGMPVTILEGRKPSKIHFRNKKSIFVINFEILGAWEEFLLDLDPQLIIIDEVHRIKSRSTQCTKHAINLCRYCPYILALSGTPLTNEPAELYTVLNILWPEKFKSYFAFAQRYTNAKYMPWGWQYKGSKNLPELHSKLKEIGMLRRRKSEVLKELPDKMISVLPQRLTRPKMREYTKARTDFLNWLARKSKSKVQSAMKAQQLVKIGYLKRLAAELKLDDVKRWIDDFLQESDQKLLVFGIHKNILQPLHARYKEKSVLIDGDTTGKKRHASVNEFRRKEEKQIAFCNITSGGVGLNMPEAHDVFFAEIPWTPAELDQAISRAHRMGQTDCVNVRIMVAQDTIEEHLCEILQDKQTITDAILDGGVEESFRLNIFDQLAKRIGQ